MHALYPMYSTTYMRSFNEMWSLDALVAYNSYFLCILCAWEVLFCCLGQLVTMQTMILLTSQSIALARTGPVISTNILESDSCITKS